MRRRRARRELCHTEKGGSIKKPVPPQSPGEDPNPNRAEPTPTASTGIDQGSQGHPVLFTLDRRGHHGRRMLSVLITACEAVLHEIQDIKWGD